MCFCLSFLLTLAHISRHNPESRIILDSEFYLQTAQRIVTVVFAPEAATFAIKDFGNALVSNGPTVPLFIVALSELTGKPPSEQNALVIFLGQAFLQALTAGMIASLGHKLTRRKSLGLLAGIVWAIYPGALTSSCLLFAEGMATFSLVLLAWLTSRLIELSGGGDAKGAEVDRVRVGLSGWALAIGFCTGWLLLTRSPLLPAALVLDVLCFWAVLQRRPRRQAVLLTLACTGLAALLIPWAVTSKVTTGNLAILPSRFPSWNLALGSDTFADGWQTMPVSPFTVGAYTRKPTAIITKAIQQDPGGFIAMTLRKTVRLWGRPWLDYHKNIFELNSIAMTIMHQVICLLGALGIMAACAQIRFNRTAWSERPVLSKFIATASTGIVLSHLAYVPFEAIPRYAVTSMPFLILLGAFALSVMTNSRLIKVSIMMLVPPVVSLLAICNFDFVPALVQLTGSFAMAQLAVTICEVACVGLSIFAGWTIFKDSSSPNNERRFPDFYSCVTLTAAVLSVAIVFAFSLRPETEWRCLLHEGQSAVRVLTITDGATGGGSLKGSGAPAVGNLKGAEGSATSAVSNLKGAEGSAASAVGNLKGAEGSAASAVSNVKVAERSGTPVKCNPDWVALLVDADRWLEQARVRINGRDVPNKTLSINDVPTSYQYQATKLYITDLVTRARGDDIKDNRQWRLIPLAVSDLNFSGRNEIEVSVPQNAHPLNIYGDYTAPGITRLPSLQYYTIGKLQYSLDQQEGRISESISSQWQTVDSRCLIDNGRTEITPARQYRIYLMCGYGDNGSTITGNKSANPTFIAHRVKIF